MPLLRNTSKNLDGHTWKKHGRVRMKMGGADL